MPKTLDDHFIDWESETFGFGYGTGEEYVLPTLKRFLEAMPDMAEDGVGASTNCYDHELLSFQFTPVVAWLMLNALGQAGLIDYGTSPRYGWLSETGIALRRYVAARTIEQLHEILERDDGEHFIHCYRGHCNCDDGPCHNPFWTEDSKRTAIVEQHP